MLKRMLLGNETVELNVPTKYVIKIALSGFILGMATKVMIDEWLEIRQMKWQEEFEKELLEAE